jgi:transketolase
MRNAFADEVTQLAQEDPRVVLLSGDIGNRLFDTLRAQSTKQFFNCGVAEQNMMGVAAGMGLAGLRPIVYTITPFTTVRCLEQVKVGVAYHRSPVIIVGTGSGLSYASLGPTHHSLEDFAIFRAIPNLQVLAPWDAKSMRSCLRQAHASKIPTYIRIGKKGEPDLTGSDSVPALGESLTRQTGSDICIVAVGTVASEAIQAAALLGSSGIRAQVELLHTIKPTPHSLFSMIVNKFDVIITVEEHSQIGGLGESFLSYLASRRLSKLVATLGTGDAFMPTVGTQHYARSFFGIDALGISSAATYLLR